ncbi:MAG: sensor histidine kinase [Acidimicrobiia bacterium]
MREPYRAGGEDELAGLIGAINEMAASLERSEARRLDRLVADLIDLARIRVHAFGLGHRPVDLGEVVAGTAEGLRPDLKEAGLSLLVETPPAPVLVSGDPDRIAQIAANLIDNAGRYAARGVLVRVAAAGPVVTLDVADDGPGMPPGDRTAVFERTFVAGRPAARSSPGSGLGLAIVRELAAAAMGAEVSVTDGIDGDARLVVSFPILDPRA